MAGPNPTLTKTYNAGGAVANRRIVKFSAHDAVVQGAAATDLLIGVSAELDVPSGQPVDVHRDGLVEVRYGGNVTRGQELTSDADGKAIYANPAQGVNNRVIGIAEVSGVADDIGVMLIAQSVKQGA